MKQEFACYVTPFTRILFIFLQVVGIDLGTTNSAVAAMEGGKPTIVTNAEGVFLLMILSVASSTRAASVRGCAVSVGVLCAVTCAHVSSCCAGVAWPHMLLTPHRAYMS